MDRKNLKEKQETKARQEKSGISNCRERILVNSTEDSLVALSNRIDLLIKEVRTNKSGTSPWMTIEEAAEYVRLSVSSLRKLVRDNKIPYVRSDPRKGRSKLFFHKKQVDLWMFINKPHATKKQRALFRPYLYGFQSNEE